MFKANKLKEKAEKSINWAPVKHQVYSPKYPHCSLVNLHTFYNFNAHLFIIAQIQWPCEWYFSCENYRTFMLFGFLLKCSWLTILYYFIFSDNIHYLSSSDITSLSMTISGSIMLLKMALFLWLSNIPLYICITFFSLKESSYLFFTLIKNIWMYSWYII